MSLLKNKDFFFQLNHAEKNLFPKRKLSNRSMENKLKDKFECPAPTSGIKKVNSITIFHRKKKRQSMNRSNGNILNDYLHSRKFGIQRKKTRKKTCKVQENDNHLTLKMNRSYFNNKENMTMIYEPKDKKTKIKKNRDATKKKETKSINLKDVEISLILKLNSMRNNFQNETNNNNQDSFDNYFENSIFQKDTIGSKNTGKEFSNTNKSIDNKKLTAVNKNAVKKSTSLFGNNNSYRINNLDNNNYQSNNFINNNHKNSSMSVGHKSKRDYINNSIDKKSSFDQKMDKEDIKLNGEAENRRSLKNVKKSTKSLNIYDIKEEKNRYLSRIKNLYDSFDDDESESERDDNSKGSCILPNYYIVLITDFLLFVCSLYSLFYIPLRMAKSDCFCGNENIINVLLLYFIDILYIVDFCLGFFKAYYNFQLKVIKNNKRIVFHYLKTDGSIDFLEAIPFFSLTKFLCKISRDANYCFRFNMSNSLIILKILTNLKIFKIFKVRNKRKNVTFNHLFNLFSENYYLEKLIDNFLNFSFCFLAFHFFVCLNIFLSKQTYPNWLLTNNSQDSDFIHNYIISSYSLIETLTTVGYGDVVCQSNIERIFQIFFLGVGVIAYSYLISSFGNLFKNESQSSINYSNNMKILEEIRVDYPKMPYKLYNKIYNYIESRNMARKKSDANILTNSLPFNLKNALLLIMYRAHIRNFKIFKGCENSNFIIEILSNFIPSTSKKNEFLVYEGEMIEDIIIIKDGRLSLEAAIDIEDQEGSIRKYFNVNFEGITTEKEIKKLNEKMRESNTKLIQTRSTHDFDNVKSILNTAVKKQANNLLNEACDDTSFLDRTKNDNKNENKQDGIKNSPSGHLKHEPIKNEKGNFKYIKIIDIRKNENFGGLYIFMRKPSPLSLKVRSKFADLYLIPKKEVFNIAKNHSNIWNKIHKKDFHNMLSIKHKTFNILNKYIEINGICKITPNDVSRYVYAWEDIDKKNKNSNVINEVDNTKDNNITNQKKYLYFKQISNPSSINCKNVQNPKNIKPNLFSNKSIDKAVSPSNKENQPIPTEIDFSHLLTLMVNERQKNNNLNTNSNQITSGNNLNNNGFKNNNNNNNNIKEEESSRSFASNFFDNRQKTEGSDDGKTFILPKNSEKLLPTLNNIFNENKVEKIKEEIKKTRKKENKKKIFSFGKDTAKIFRNDNYSIFIIGKSTNECIEIKNKNNFILPSKSLIPKDKDINMHNYISFCQNILFLDKISEISSSEENYLHHFESKDLFKESTTSFSLESIYENINLHSKMIYSKDKDLQQKTLNYLDKLIQKKNNNFSSSKSLSDSLSISKSSSFSNNILTNERKSNLLSLNMQTNQISNKNSYLFNSQKNEQLSSENSFFKSENSSVPSRSIKILDTNKQDYNSLKSNNRGSINKKFRNRSLKPKQSKIKSEVEKKSKHMNCFGNTDKITFKFDSNDNFNSEKEIYKINSEKEIDKSNAKSKKQSQSIFPEINHKNTNYLNLPANKSSIFLLSDNITKSNIINNIKTVKSPKNGNKLSLNFNINTTKRSSNIIDKKSLNKRSSLKPKLSKKYSKRKSKSNNQPNKFKSEQKLVKIEMGNEKDGLRNSLDYFAKEEKEDCIII